MGYRSSLQVYLNGEKLHQDERRYYEAVIQNQKNYTDEGYQALGELAKEVIHVWNEHFDFIPGQIPSCQFVDRDGKRYYSPDKTFSQEEDLIFERKNFVPDEFLRLFSREEYIDKQEYNGGFYGCHKFYTTPEKALERIANNDSMNGMKEWLRFIPQDSILELDATEVIDNEDMYDPISINDVINRMNELELERVN